MPFLNIPVNNNRIYGLDIMRVAAIFFVTFGHAAALLPTRVSKCLAFVILDGVTIFFVLSGFLIGGIIIKTISNEGFSIRMLRNFWLRRWWRTLPNYFLVLVLLSLLKLIFEKDMS